MKNNGLEPKLLDESGDLGLWRAIMTMNNEHL